MVLWKTSTVSSSSINPTFSLKVVEEEDQGRKSCSREIEEVEEAGTSMKSPPEEKLMNIFWLRPAYQRHSLGMPWRSTKKRLTVTSTLIVFFLVISISALVFAGLIDLAKFSGHSSENAFKIHRSLEFPLDCSAWNQTNTCPRNYPTTYNPNPSSSTECPDYFRWIHEDLRHWKETGITRDMMEGVRKNAHFRLVILNGKLYVEKYRKSIQTRDLFTIWGIAQLLRIYPGRLPDLELMFDCDDRPVIAAKSHRGPNARPPPLFRYCSDWRSLDIVFPDWSFWGWAETNIRPWKNVLRDIKEGNNRTKWKDREPYAYWKGNPHVAPWRGDLMKCNVTDKEDWNTRLYVQDWNEEAKKAYKESNLGDQCTHRYKIYIEGWAWSVSEKYILACNSPTLYLTPRWYDFFIRGMIPQKHYWPVRDNDKCRSLKYAVEYGNNHLHKSVLSGPIPKHNQHSKAFETYTKNPSCYFKCKKELPVSPNNANSSAIGVCPGYFRWIHEDLKPWKETGITKAMVERAKDFSDIRVIILSGKLYVEKQKRVFQTRDVVTIWGILQLLRLYPGKLPDMDLMFECGDKPVIHKSEYGRPGASIPPPLFHYCGDELTFDIVFPDWSFWGWSELKIKPWEFLKTDLQEKNYRMKWMDREPHAFWKGTAKLSRSRLGLMKCNLSKSQDWNARIFNLDWMSEQREGFKTVDLGSQCTYRYKIYVEGRAWSVSQKYILACDSMSLLITPHYYDFYSRSLLPTVHYWPINENNKCKSIKFAVNWGNTHAKEAQDIGKAGSKFIQDELRMKYVYDYMFHLLHEYAKLLKYQPTVPESAVEVCSEMLIRSSKELRKFMKQTMVNSPADSSPCILQSPYDQTTLEALVVRKANLTKQVELLEAREYVKKKHS